MSVFYFYIETYGCQMNEYDSLIAASILEKSGARMVTEIASADIIVINTCAVREKAQEKIINRVRSLDYLRKKKKLLIGVIGCVAQSEKEKLLHKINLDFIIGPDSLRFLEEIPNLLQKKGPKKTDEVFLQAELSKKEKYEDIDIFKSSVLIKPILKGTVTIQRGCNNFCSFCVVPFTRGRERSKSPNSIIEEIKKWEDYGSVSVLLLGQNVNSYFYERISFAGLLEKILSDTTIKKISFTSPHPKDFPEELLRIIGSEERIISHLHLPLQSGSDNVLMRMKRDYTQKEFLSLVEKAYHYIPHLNLTTDVIVGFPDENEEDFKQTLSTMKAADFDSAFMFAYSERKHTYAQKKYIDNIPLEVKKDRLQIIIDEQYKRSKKKNEQWIGREISVIPEKYARRGEEYIISMAFNGKKVLIPSQNKFEPGTEQIVKVKASTPISLFSE